MYARFFTKALNDLGLLGFREPFARLLQPGDDLPPRREDVEVEGQRRRARRAASARYGADALRLYILFMGPADQDKEWQDTGVEGMARFLQRLWRVVHEAGRREPPVERRRRPARAQGARDDRAR